MKNISVIYWSGTGNTQRMAVAIGEGAKSKGASVNIIEVDSASKEDIGKADAIALGCPSMGCEVLEEDSMEPFVQSLNSEDIKDKPILLFGSYDWGDGQWMRDWTERMAGLGAKLIGEGLIVQNTPGEEELAQCRQSGIKLAET